MATEFRKLLVREGLESSAGNLDPREIGITTDTERPMFGTASGTKFGATEKIVEISVAAPPALDQIINTVSEIACDTDAAGAGIALNILAGASKSPAILAISNRGATHSVTVTYKTATTFTISPGYTAWVLWDDEGWTLLAADTARNATLLQGYTPGLDGTLPSGDAGKVSRYGIGVDTCTAYDGDLNLLIKGGNYFATYGAGYKFPAGESVAAEVAVYPLNSDNCVQELYSRTSNTRYYRRKLGGTWDDLWSTVWTSGNDGNAGQPPAPKPTTGTPAGGADAPGQVIVEVITGSTAPLYYSGSVAKTGTWELDAMVVNSDNSFYYRFYGIGSGASTYASSMDASRTHYVVAKRTS